MRIKLSLMFLLERRSAIKIWVPEISSVVLIGIVKMGSHGDERKGGDAVDEDLLHSSSSFEDRNYVIIKSVSLLLYAKN